MTKNDLEIDVEECLKVIEQRLGWGPSANWSTYDFSKLSDDVHKRTQVRLSITTLKRIWGKVKYESAPTLTTLNALAQFAGFEDWRKFCQHRGGKQLEAQPSQNPNANASEHHTSSSRKRFKRSYVVLLAIPLLAISFIFIMSKGKTDLVDADKFRFRADKMITEGVPNSVVFHYDASAADTDSVFIVQTWDIRRKKLVSRQKHEHSALYYYPGFFKTKLIVDKQVVKTHDLWITSDGWLCLAEEEPAPLYFKKGECVRGDSVAIDAELLSRYNLALHPSPPKIRIFNQRDFGSLMSDNFIFETKVRSGFTDGANACQPIQVLIQCKNDIIMIPLGARACVGNMQLYFCGKGVSSVDADLSGFGSDLNQWTTLRVEVVKKHVVLKVNGAVAYELDFPNDPTGVVGVQYRFNGTGAVKDTWFGNGGNVTKL
jgi:hypothetical protein